ncbi:HupE/UreJ protein [Dyadobacter jejuensis]|uniref:HupE/UreJ protein n=1 Tax=Dyadobacter jejuensis TaxID=1082580 RepID=A0A316AR51_9BACT|nr:HupE/UreJ family protein [Dyadobacter jejuensis]PWJ60213.1 HupE/UreJ protein [Dyadobacter jejuensis]
MSDFQAYFLLGFEHITDANGYDHILFIMALCSIYTLVEFKKVFILVTAFTIGHSITLALATLNIVSIAPDLIELLIPITILMTAFANFFYKPPVFSFIQKSPKVNYRYPVALGFGLIHGMGFSNYLRALLGGEADIVYPLLGFNLGLEIGQLIIVVVFLSLSFVLVEILRVTKLTWNLIISGIIAGMAISLIFQNEYLPSLFNTAAN